ncbi:MAG: helix-turn-helix domain-containing protein [Oscillospiraceae bacterium]|nr:helix-turn-helix domain-containing protein [Oscillospiraceae bacterium]
MNSIPVINMNATGQNIARLRKAAGITVRELQEVFGFSTPQAIYKWQNGSALPTVDNLLVLSAVLQVSIDEILISQPFAIAHTA